MCPAHVERLQDASRKTGLLQSWRTEPAKEFPQVRLALETRVLDSLVRSIVRRALENTERSGPSRPARWPKTRSSETAPGACARSRRIRSRWELVAGDCSVAGRRRVAERLPRRNGLAGAASCRPGARVRRRDREPGGMLAAETLRGLCAPGTGGMEAGDRLRRKRRAPGESG